MKRILVALLILAALPAAAQTVSLTVTKSGSDVVLTWTGGTGPYVIAESRHPSMSVRAQLVGTTSGTTITDTGGAAVMSRLIFYVVSDSTAPTVAVTGVSPNFSRSHPFVCASGTSASATSTVTAVYCNSILATGTTTWTTCNPGYGVPIAVPFDQPAGLGRLLLQAACKDSNDNWGFSWLLGTWIGTLGTRDPVLPRGVGR